MPFVRRGTTRLGRTHFHTERQVAMIEGHGAMAAVTPCVKCPCQRAEGQYDPLCPSCGGNGRYYVQQARFTTSLMMQQETSQLTYLETGTWMHGVIKVSILPGVELGENDHVLFPDLLDMFDEILRKDTQDVLRFSSGITMQFVVDRTTMYREGQDYQLGSGHTIEWLAGGHAPAFDAQYSVRYDAHPEYLVSEDSPRLRMEHRRGQSSVVMLKRLDRLNRESPF